MSFRVDASKTARGTLGFVVQNSANSLLGLLLFAIFARFVTKGEMGVYAGFSFTSTLFQSLAVLGLNFAGPRFVAKLLAEGDRLGASAVARKIMLVSLGAGGALALTHCLLAPQFSLLLSQTYNFTEFFVAASGMVLVIVPMLVVEGLMQGVQEYGRLATLKMVAQFLRVLVSVWLLLGGWGLFGMIAGWIILGVTVLLGSTILLSLHLDLAGGSYPLDPIFKYSIPMLAAGLVSFLSNSVDIFIVMTYGSPADLGTYNVAVTASGALVTILVVSATATLLPTTSACFGAGGFGAVERVFYKSTRYLALLYTPAALGLASLAWPVVWFMGGPAYRDSTLPLAIISLSFLAYSLSTPLTVSLQAVGETKRVLKIVLGGVAAGSLTAAALFPVLGILGAALGRVCLFTATLLVGLYETKKVFKPKFDLDALWKSVLASSVMAASVYLVASRGASTTTIPLGVLLGGVLYILMLRLLRAVRPEDIRVLSEVLLAKLGRFSKPLERLAERLLV